MDRARTISHRRNEALFDLDLIAFTDTGMMEGIIVSYESIVHSIHIPERKKRP